MPFSIGTDTHKHPTWVFTQAWLKHTLSFLPWMRMAQVGTRQGDGGKRTCSAMATLMLLYLHLASCGPKNSFPCQKTTPGQKHASMIPAIIISDKPVMK